MYCTVLQRIRQIQKPIAEVAKGTSVIGIDRLVILLLVAVLGFGSESGVCCVIDGSSAVSKLEVNESVLWAFSTLSRERGSTVESPSRESGEK